MKPPFYSTEDFMILTRLMGLEYKKSVVLKYGGTRSGKMIKYEGHG